MWISSYMYRTFGSNTRKNRKRKNATIDEIRDGTRKFAECTWVKGYTSDSIKILLTGWYEMNNTGLCPVDSLEWTEDMEFK